MLGWPRFELLWVLPEDAGLILTPDVDPDTCHSWPATGPGTEGDALHVRRLQGEAAQNDRPGNPWR